MTSRQIVRCQESEPTQRPKCSASAPTRCAAGSAVTATRRRSAPSATTATTSWWSCRPCATRSPRPATSPRRSSWPASARRPPPATASLLAAFESFDEAAADRAIEESLALRPLERTVEELLLPAIDRLAADPDREAELEFASRWATGWLHGARRLAPPPRARPGSCCSTRADGQDAEAVHAQALDLALRRAGFRVLVLSNELGDERLERALGALDPTAIVLCGPGADTQGAVRLVRKIRELGFVAPLFGFRATGLIGDAVPAAGESPSQVTGMLNADLRRRAAQAFA